MAPRGALIAFCFVQAFRSYRSRGRKRERDVRRNAPRAGVGRAQPREPRPSDGQCRNDLTGRVTTGRHPCSPREVTPGASPPRPGRAGRVVSSIIPSGARGARGVVRVRARRASAHLPEPGADACAKDRFGGGGAGRGERRARRRTRDATLRVARDRSVQKRSHGQRNDRTSPVFTPGSNARRLPAAVVAGRVAWFLHHPTASVASSPDRLRAIP